MAVIIIFLNFWFSRLFLEWVWFFAIDTTPRRLKMIKLPVIFTMGWREGTPLGPQACVHWCEVLQPLLRRPLAAFIRTTPTTDTLPHDSKWTKCIVCCTIPHIRHSEASMVSLRRPWYHGWYGSWSWGAYDRLSGSRLEIAWSIIDCNSFLTLSIVHPIVFKSSCQKKGRKKSLGNRIIRE